MSWRRLPPLHAIRAFEAAARHRSMTRAAEELGVTPGAVSRHVRALEEHLQKALFLRGATGLTPTSAGEALALATRDGLDRIADGASGVRLQRLRRLSIGVYGFFVSRMLLPLWTDSAPRIPNSRSIFTPVRILSTCCPAAMTPSSRCPTPRRAPD